MRRRTLRPRRPRRVVRRRRAPVRRVARKSIRGVNGVPDIAMLSEVRTNKNGMDPSGNYITNTMYSFLSTRLQDFPRAVQVAQAYQYYKMKRITLTIKYAYDTFNAGLGQSRPNLYYLIDKGGNLPTNSTLELLKSCGAVPRVIDNRSFSISWTPSVLNVVNDPLAANNVGAQYKISPWLNTNVLPEQPGAWNPSSIEHLGLFFYVEQLLGQSVYQLETKVEFAFKKPLWKLLPGAPKAISANQYAELDTSPDGVEGGAV